MHGGFVPAPHDLRCMDRNALDGAPAEEERCGKLCVIKRIEHAPQARPHAIAEDLFLPDVALAGFDHADHLAHALGDRIAVTDLKLRAFLEVDHNRDRKLAPAGPGDVRPVSAITGKIAHRHRPQGTKAESDGFGCQRSSPSPPRQAWAIASRRANQTPGLLAA